MIEITRIELICAFVSFFLLGCYVTFEWLVNEYKRDYRYWRERYKSLKKRLEDYINDNTQ